MSGFKASEVVEELTYDFHPHVDAAGTIPEPTADAIDRYRTTIAEAFKASGLDPEQIAKESLGVDTFISVIEKSHGLEASLLVATAELCGIPVKTLQALPYRVAQAFTGWIMGVFFSPEASAPATK